MLEVELFDELDILSSEEMELVEKVLQKAAEMENIPANSEVSVTFVDDARIQELNSEYRNKNVPTDVISFALNDEVDDEIEITGVDLPNLLGDIIISIPRAREQANAYGHSFERELAFLSVHGLLHLLGYDHETKEEETVMFSKQEEILAAYGLKR